MSKKLEELFSKAYTLQHQGQLLQAKETYEAILPLAPQHPQTLHFLGLTHAQLGDMNQAIHYFNQALTVTPDDPSLFNNLANAYKKSKQLEKAISCYLEAIKLKPNYAQAHNNLATIYAAQNQYQQALLHYKKAVHAQPDLAPAHFNLGLLLLQHNELAAAKIQFNNVLSLNPSHTDAQFYSAVLYLQDNLLTEAQKAFRKVLEQNEEHVEALVNLGVIALKQDSNQEAVDFFSKALALDNEHKDARSNLAATFMHHDRFENALMHYDVLLKVDPDNTEYLYNSGVAQMALGHLDEALDHFEHLIENKPQHGPALNNMAAIYLRKEQRKTAGDFLERALAVNPKDVVSQHMLNALTGNTQKAATNPEYAENLFNNYALYYDQHMQGLLQYSIPQHIMRTLHHKGIIEVHKTLDLGCGTGLTGVILREFSQQLIGVDIAPKMLALAEKKGIYDKLLTSELQAFFKHNQEHYDLIVAADVLPYFGDLKTVFQAVHQHLRANGHFIFTTEISALSPWKLEASARFSHHPDYIQELAEEFHFKISEIKKIPGRIQDNKVLEVMLYVFNRSLRTGKRPYLAHLARKCF